MVVVKISETYDLNTVRDKMGVIGIHTPSEVMIRKMWPGFFDNYKFIKILHGNIRIACASYLPADPLQVGTSTGQIAPQDMFNPILYKAVSNESFELIVNSIYKNNDDFLSGGSVTHAREYPDGTQYTNWDYYYGLLAQPGWKKAMPQAGLEMKKLTPLVHTMLSNFGNQFMPPDPANLNTTYTLDANGDSQSQGKSAGSPGRIFRGKVVRMPRLPTASGSSWSVSTDAILPLSLPTIYCGCIIMPPSKLNTLYYRLKVDWFIEFSVPRSIQHVQALAFTGDLGWSTYFANYGGSSKDSMDHVTDSVDTIGAEIEKVMES